MLLMKAWMETRWRLLALTVYLLIGLAMNLGRPGDTIVLATAWSMVTFLAIALGGSGVNSQAPFVFSEGLAGSTQFTISLPVTRLRLFTVRAAVGLIETAAVTALAALFIWAVFPALRAIAAPGDYARLVLTTILFLTAPYCAHVLFSTWSAEPFSIVYSVGTLILLLLLCHHLSPGLDIVRAFGDASPLRTHRVPWPQLMTSVTLASILSSAAFWVVRTREY